MSRPGFVNVDRLPHLAKDEKWPAYLRRVVRSFRLQLTAVQVA